MKLINSMIIYTLFVMGVNSKFEYECVDTIVYSLAKDAMTQLFSKAQPTYYLRTGTIELLANAIESCNDVARPLGALEK